jgi:NADH-quinone oxidoreductase subunit G
MSKCIIDGKEIEFDAGESVIAAAKRNDIEIPYYCWHSKLSVAANCRMCLVEVEKAPKLLPACQTTCQDGMVVNTENARVKDAQRAVHEFLLINHPIDCPICDQAGECKLQDYYMDYHQTPSRMIDKKVNKPRLEELGPHVMYNAERCIMCTLCVRFMEEVPEESQLGIFNRGDHAVIGTVPGQTLDNDYSLNTVDICPVGALTSRVFRFKQRAWNLSRSESICGGCARGCNTHVDHRGNQVYRILPRSNDAVNECWMCDDGRLTYQRANENNLNFPRIQDDGESVNVGADVALDKVVELLGPARAGGVLGAALSLHATIEEAYAFGLLVRDTFGVNRVTLLGFEQWLGDEVLKVDDRNPNRQGISMVLRSLGLDIEDAKALFERIDKHEVKAMLCVGHECDGYEALSTALEQVEVLVHLGAAESVFSEQADVVLPKQSWLQTEGTWLNHFNRLQRLRPALASDGGTRGALSWFADIASALDNRFAWDNLESLRIELESNTEALKNIKLGQIDDQGLEISSRKML